MPTTITNLRLREEALREEQKSLHAEARELVAAEQQTAESRERFNAIDARLEEIKDDLVNIQKEREWERTEAKAVEPGSSLGSSFPRQSDAPIHTQPAHGKQGPYASFGEQLQDIYKAARGDLAARDTLTGYLAAEGANIAIDSEGGFLVQTDFATEIRRIMHDTGSLLARVARIPLSPNANGIKIPVLDETSRADGSRWGGIQGYWLEEGGTKTPSQPSFARLSLELHKVAALGYATDELLSDAPAMSAIFTQGFAEELLFKVEDAIFEGDGAGKPRGIINSAAAVSVAKETGQSAATVLHNNIINMWARLHPRSRANAVWFINQEVESALDTLVQSIGVAGQTPYYVDYGPSGALRIKGRPVVTVEYAAALGTVGDIVLADMSQYAFIERGGIEQAQSIHVRFTTDETAFRAVYRVDGQLFWESPLTPFKGTATLSPVVTLATRA